MGIFPIRSMLTAMIQWADIRRRGNPPYDDWKCLRMKVFLLLVLAAVVLLVWLRTGLRLPRPGRGFLMEIFMFALAIAGFVGLILLAGRLF